MSARAIICIAAILGGLAVITGAFGAHALKERLDPAALVSFETAVRYQFYHALVLLVVGLWLHVAPVPGLRPAAACLLAGSVLFSGSIYLLSTRTLLPFGSLRFLGPVTPLGGLLFIAGWIQLALAALRLRGVVS
ncbi:MAG: DUF423 domain-containing protein [Lentisphaerae bacterium]|nr:DUF423 domain-containing protein [Lentisphaerota bacterium]